MDHQLSILNPFPKRLPGPDLLHHLVPKAVDRQCAAIEFLSSQGTVHSLSYEDLHHRSDALARVLQTRRRNEATSQTGRFIVPLFISQCLELYIAELACLKAGAAFCPISLDVPDERLRFILDDVNAKIILTTSLLRDKLPDIHGVNLILVDGNPSESADEDVPVTIDTSDAAYVMYTSGSTGQPKGVIVSHSAATQALLAHDSHIPQFTRFLQFASPTFDVSVFEIFFPLFRGRTIVAGERRLLLNDLPNFINHMNIDAAELTPSVASSLLRGRASVPKLKLLLTIGEMLKRDVIEEFGTSEDDEGILHGMYGPTEATIHCTLQTSFSRTMPTGNIGVPLDTVSAFIAQPSSPDKPSYSTIDILPIGDEGELVVGGHQIADEYLNRKEQTKASFILHPEYGMLYRTGDRVRMTPSGTLECLGRISAGQMKLRGQRIELGEIEYAASRTGGVRSVVAEVIDGTLVVFCHTTTDVRKRQIEESCRSWLPGFMVPRKIILLDSLPYLSSGKIDKGALRNIYSDQRASIPGLDGTAALPNSRLIEIVSSILLVPVTPETKLSSVGLDSLSSIRVASELRRAGFPHLDAIALLESETIHDIDLRLRKLEVEPVSLTADPKDSEISSKIEEVVNNHPTLAGRLSDIEHVFACTPVQSAMLAGTAQDGQAYCNSVEFSVSGYSISRIAECIRDLAKHHELLRSGFLHVNEQEASHATIVWKALESDQILTRDRFEYHFTIQSEADFLHPCGFQLVESGNGTRLLLRIHHALYDQWSIDVLRHDLSALLLDRPIPTPLSFRTISQFTNANLQIHRSEQAFEFWEDVLRNVEPVQMPLMNAVKQERNLRRTSWRTLPMNLSQIRTRSRELSCSVPVVFQAALSYLLGCYVGRTDITLGVVFSGRHLSIPGIEGVLGPCLATLPLRIDYSSTRTRSDLLQLIRNRNRDLQRHALTPLADIKRISNCSPGSQLFDVLFVWQETAIDQEDDGIVREVDSTDHHEYNLVLEFVPSGDCILAKATYQQALISLQQVEILLEQINAIVEAIVAEPESLVQNLSSCLPRDLLSISNPTPKYFAEDCGLVSAIENHAQHQPNSTALVFANSITDQSANVNILTYNELNARANRMARHLQTFNVAQNDLICICMEKSESMYIAILAVIKAGGGYLPLDPDVPVSRLKSILSQASVNVSLCDSRTIFSFETIPDLSTINVDEMDLRGFDASNATVTEAGSDVAYTIFTSGSTGEPKGVVVTRDNLLGNLRVLQELYQVQSGDRLLQACSQAFDVSVFEIFFAWYTGMSLCSGTKETILHDIEAAIRALDISHLSLTPTVAALVDPNNVPSVRFLVTAGEGLTNVVHQRWAGKGLHQGYGPSETTNICTIKMHVSSEDALTNIGRPLFNTSAFVLSTESGFGILPAGSVGELAFGGEQVFRGYLGMDALNAEKIIEHPELGRVYRSGDLGRILHDGSLLICGRMDDQVKIRGNRVELGDINSVLVRELGVNDCATLFFEDKTLGQLLAAFVVVKSQQDINWGRTQAMLGADDLLVRLFDCLETSLPIYMVPDLLVPVNQLPLTSQGKLNRRELRSVLENLDAGTRASFTRGREDGDDSRVWTHEELEMAKVLQDMLDIPKGDLSRNKSLFAYGVNSLNAIAFAKLATARLGTRIAVPLVLRHPTIARLARALRDQNVVGGPGSADISNELLPSDVVQSTRLSCKSFADNVECFLPCTPLQEAMLSASSSEHKSTYTNSLTLRFNGDLQVMKDCWRYMVERHQILRTRFITTEHPNFPFVQVVLKSLPLPWRESESFDGSSSLESRRSGAITTENPFIIDVYKNESGARLVLRMHHAIYDAISISTLLREAELVTHGVKLPAPPSFREFLGAAQKHNSEDAMAFWSSQIEGFEPKPFPQIGPSDIENEEVLEAILPFSSDELASYCRQNTVSPVAAFQAAVVKVLQCCQNTDDICVGNVVSGRTLPVEGIENLVAPCFNTIPIRASLVNIDTNLALIRKLNRTNVEASEYQLTPLRRIQRLSLVPFTRLFDALLILQPEAQELDTSIWQIESEAGYMGLPLVFEVQQQKSGSYKLLLHFLHRSFSRDFAETISRAFLSAFDACVRYPHGSVGYFEGCDGDGIAGSLPHAVTSHDGDQLSGGGPGNQWGPVEKVIRQTFSQLASISERSIERDTTLYQVGLDSLNAHQVAARLRGQGFNVDAADIMEAPTPSLLAALIERKASVTLSPSFSFDFENFERERRDAVLESPLFDPLSIEAIRPCTSVQSGMLAQSLDSDGRLYVNHVTYDVPQQMSSGSIIAAWNRVRERHQALRMGFHQDQTTKDPFAMVIFRSNAVSSAFLDEVVDMQLDHIEERAHDMIMQSLDSQPWRVTICHQRDASSMTLSLHHALYDAESLSLILSDFSRALASSALQQSPTIDSLLSFIIKAEADPAQESEEYWRKTLRDINVSKFPDLTPNVVSNAALASESFTCSLSLPSLEHFCKGHGATIQAIGQTAWGLLLSAYTGDDNITFGTIWSGRSDPALSGTIFPSINVMPVPCKTSCSISELLHTMVTLNASSQRHHSLPLSEIQRVAGLPGRPLFDTVFVYQKLNSDHTDFTWPLVRETSAVDYCASLELENKGVEEVSIRLTFDTSRIPHQQASLIVRQYDHILGQIVSGNSQQSASADSIWSKLPAFEACIPSAVTLLHEFVEQLASKYPDRKALEFVRRAGDGVNTSSVWSYRQLEDVANQIAHLIVQAGLPPNSMVAVCMDKCPEASFAFVGILKAGCSFLAMDPELPETRQRFILEDSNTRLLFGDQASSPFAMPSNVQYLQLELSTLDAYPSSPITREPVASDATCYCLYTSGTTGTPKGCEISHESAVQAMHAFQRLFSGRWTESSRWLQFASYWFDVSILEHFWSWSIGITVVGAPRDLVLEDLAGFLSSQQITHIDLTPSLARLLKPDDVPSLWNGVFITGGEALKQEIIDAWGPTHTICNGYGPTEATIGVTMNTFIGRDAKPSNIGRQFDNVGTYVLHPGSDDLVLRSTIGELCVSGKLVGKGYLNRPDLTSKSFPFLERWNERVYRTGDLVRMLADGSFAFVGRADSQAKLRGQRLELGEIDNTLRNSSTEINDVVSLVVKTQDEEREMLISFLTMNGHGKVDQLQLRSSESAIQLVQTAREACVSHLPGYMVPTHILLMDCLPLTVNNKIDTKRLTSFFNSMPAQDLRMLQRVGGTSRPLSKDERRVCEVLQEMLCIDATGITATSNLFSLGLSSISAIPFSSLLKKAGFSNASIMIVMRNPTLEQLVSALMSNSPKGQIDTSVRQAELWMTAFHHRHLLAGANTLSLSIDDIEAAVPCTPLQQGLIVDSIKDDRHPNFNQFRYKVTAGSFSRLKEALDKLVNASQILRAQFIDTSEGMAQVILRKGPATLSRWILGPEKPETFFSQLRSQWISRNSYSLAIPLEFHFVTIGVEAYFLLNIHHALYDAVSYPLILRLLSDIYDSVEPTRLGPEFTKALAYGPLRTLSNAWRFWKDRLEGFRHTPLSMRAITPPLSNSTLSFHLEEVVDIEDRRKDFGVSHQALLQTCFEIALRQCVKSTQLYGLVSSGRSIDLEGADRVLGPMFNTLPHPLNLSSIRTLAEQVRYCHRLNVEALPFQHTALRDIHKWCGYNAGDPVFDVLFVFQHMPDSHVDRSDVFLDVTEDTPEPYYPLACEIHFMDSGRITVNLSAQGQYFSPEALEDFRDKFKGALHSILYNAEDVLARHFSSPATKTTEPTSKDQTVSAQVSDAREFEWTEQGQYVRQTLAQLCNLNMEEIDEHSTLFGLGLDSIDAVKLASRLRRGGFSIPVSKILKAQTIPRMLSALQEKDNSSEPPSENAFTRLLYQLQELDLASTLRDPERVERILPATPQQEALVADMRRSNFQEYYNHDVLRLLPCTDLGRLKGAWQEIINRTPILRTDFLEVSDPQIDSVYAQVVYKQVDVKFRERKCTSTKGLEKICRAITTEVSSGSQSSPLLRLNIVHAPSDRYLILSLAHAQYDGHSLALLHEDVRNAYNNIFESRPANDEAIDVSLTNLREDSKAHWNAMLAGARTHSIPRIRQDTEPTSVFRMERYSKISSAGAHKFCQKYDLSMQALAQTCWAATLAYYLHDLDVLFGVVLACRDSEEREKMLFPMMNTVPMRASLHGSRLIMLRYMQNTITDMRPYQRDSLRMIQAAAAKVVNADRTEYGSALFDTVFIYQHRPSPLENDRDSLYESVSGSSRIGYPVAVEAEIVGEKIAFRAACKDSVLNERGTMELLETMDSVMRALIEFPDRMTVEFQGDRVSICGSESISLNAIEFAGQQAVQRGPAKDTVMEDISSPVEPTILNVLAEVSKSPREEITPHSTIESIGIDSISGIKVAALLRKQSISISVSELIRAKTPARMAAIASENNQRLPTQQLSSSEHVQKATKSLDIHDIANRSSVKVTNMEVVMPATAGQIYFISMWQKTHGQLFYSTFTYQLKTQLHVEQIGQVWDVLVDRHSILRTVLCTTNDVTIPLVQIVLKDIAHRSSGNGAGTTRTTSRQPMASLEVIEESSGYILQLRIHHALYDAVSLPLIIQDLETLLSRESPIRPKPKFEDLIAASSATLAGESRQEFWRRYLQDAKPKQLLQLANDGAQRRVECYAPGLFSGLSDLDQTARTEHISIQSLLFAAYAKVYSNLKTRDVEEASDVILGMYLSNRSHSADSHSFPGPTLNIVPLLVKTPHQQGLLDLAKQIHEDLRNISTAENSTAGLWEIYEWTGVKIDTCVNFVRLPERDDDLAMSDSPALTPLDDRRRWERCEVIEPPEDEFEMPAELRDLRLGYVYQHAVDIEMIITNGKLDVGFFCPEAMVGLEEGKEALQELKGILEKVLGKAKGVETFA